MNWQSTHRRPTPALAPKFDGFPLIFNGNPLIGHAPLGHVATQKFIDQKSVLTGPWGYFPVPPDISKLIPREVVLI